MSEFENIEKKKDQLWEELKVIFNKLNDATLTLEEKSTLTALQKEKLKEFLEIYELYKQMPKPEIKPITRQDRIDQQKDYIELIEYGLEKAKKDNAEDSILNSLVVILEQEKEHLKRLEEEPDNIPTESFNFWRYIRDKWRSKGYL